MRLESISMPEALKLELGSTITTRFGLCRHHFSLMGCPKDKDCIRCGEITFVKGNEGHLNEARDQLAINTKAEAQARSAVEAGKYGAQRYVDMHCEEVARWQMVLDQMTDPALPDGTLITLPPVSRPQTRAGLANAIRSAQADGHASVGNEHPARLEEMDDVEPEAGNDDDMEAVADLLWGDGEAA